MSYHHQTYHFINAAAGDLSTILFMNSLLCKAKKADETDRIEMYQFAINASRTSFSAQMALLHRTWHQPPTTYGPDSLGESIRDAVMALGEAARLMKQLDAANAWEEVTKKWQDVGLIGWPESPQLSRLEETVWCLKQIREDFLKRAKGEQGFWKAYAPFWLQS